MRKLFPKTKAIAHVRMRPVARDPSVAMVMSKVDRATDSAVEEEVLFSTAGTMVLPCVFSERVSGCLRACLGRYADSALSSSAAPFACLLKLVPFSFVCCLAAIQRSWATLSASLATSYDVRVFILRLRSNNASPSAQLAQLIQAQLFSSTL